MTRSENKPSIAAVKDLMGANQDALRRIVQDLLQEMLEGERETRPDVICSENEEPFLCAVYAAPKPLHDGGGHLDEYQEGKRIGLLGFAPEGYRYCRATFRRAREN